MSAEVAKPERKKRVSKKSRTETDGVVDKFGDGPPVHLDDVPEWARVAIMMAENSPFIRNGY